MGRFGWGPKSLCLKSLCAFSVPYFCWLPFPQGQGVDDFNFYEPDFPLDFGPLFQTLCVFDLQQK